MKKLIFLFLTVFVFSQINAQTTIITDDSTYTPTSANAIFEVHSSNGNKGILIPRLTTAQRIALSTISPADNSLLVYDTDTKTFWYFDGTQWVEISTGGTVSDDQLLTFSNDTLYIENGNSVYLGAYLDNTDSQTLSYNSSTGDLTISNGNTITLPTTSGGDNWGSQTVVSDATLNGNGTTGNPLTVNGDLTDDQNLSLSGNTLNITDGTGVDLSAFMDNTDAQTLSLSGNNLTIFNGNTVTLPTGSDDQNIQGCGLSGTTLTIGIENGTSQTVNLSSLQDGTGTDDQNIQGSSVSGNNLIIGIENGNSQTVDMSHFMDNTDAQTLSLSGNNLTISNGNTVTLPTGSDDQNIQGCGLSGTTLTIGIENGTSQTVDLSSLQDGTGTDDQNLSISGHTLSIESGNSVTLPDEDQQTLSFNSSTNYLSISNGNSVDLSSLAGGASGWGLTGNSGTTAGTNFLGTTDSQDLVFKTNNTEYVRIADNGFIGIGTNAPGKLVHIIGDNSTPEDFVIEDNGGTYAYLHTCLRNTTGGGAMAYTFSKQGGNSHFSGLEFSVYTDALTLYNNALSNGSSGTPDGVIRFVTRNASGSAERVRIDNDGQVGIGTTTPTAKLHVISPNLGTDEVTMRIGPVGGGSSTSSIPSILDFWSTFDNYSSDQDPRRTASIKAHFIGGTWGNEALSFCVGSSNDSGIEPAERVRIVASGSNQTAGGSWTTLSDKRLKTDIKDIPYGLNDIMKIKPLKYIIHDPKNFNDIPKGKPQGQGREEIGFIAQDLYKIIPDVVTKPKDETKELWSLSYERMVPVLVKAIQELKQQNDEQQKLIEKLMKQNAEILDKFNNGSK